ncbi:MAG: 4Fe-4S dicluster domain-containing protein [Spirochaetaceae bacterium]|nr:4Fe-4S dicluster domain-containing protein [Spirochaetaceae bacterium]
MKPLSIDKKTRQAPEILRFHLALAVLAAFIAAYLSGSLAANSALEVLVKAQFSPLLYRGAAAGAVAAAALTLVIGRGYCSVLCPLGTAQELVFRAGAWLRKTTAKTSGSASFPVRQGYAAPLPIRYAVPVIAAAAAACSLSPLGALIDPAAVFGRGMGALRALFEGNLPALAAVLGTPLFLMLFAAFFRGRWFCNWCPVGVTLGALSSFAPLGIALSPGCRSCGICEKICPTGCISSRNGEKRLDYDRCVLCFSCVAACPGGSARFGLRKSSKTPGFPESRRAFLGKAAPLCCGAAYLAGASLPARGLSLLRAVKMPDLAVLPPGAKNIQNYASRCVGCCACGAACPVRIITLRSRLFPTLDFSRGACQYTCIECGKACPAGAIRRLSLEEKQRTRIARSDLNFRACVVNTRRESCGACAEVCPTRALYMAPYAESGIPALTRPLFDSLYCVGCGACFTACPARPNAFIISAVPEQTRTAGIRPTREDEDGAFLFKPADEFPF